MEEENPWILKAEELHECPYFRVGDALHVHMPGVQGHALCTMPLVTFLPIALGEGNSEAGTFESGYKHCACRWSYVHPEAEPSTVTGFESLLAQSENAHLPFFDQLPESLVKALLTKSPIETYSANAVILQNGIQTEFFYILKSGKARVCNRGQDGRLFGIYSLNPGECFGEMSLLSGTVTSNSVDAIEISEVCKLPKKEFFRLLAAFPALGLVLYRKLAERIRVSNDKMVQMMLPGISGDLQIFNFVDLVQTLSSSGMSGMLRISNANERSEFGFKEGKMVYAATGNLSGDEAVTEVVRWTKGSFRFHSQENPPTMNLAGDTLAIILEAIRLLDEALAAEG